jgi:DNA-directed RNA polymerase beta subunit
MMMDTSKEFDALIEKLVRDDLQNHPAAEVHVDAFNYTLTNDLPKVIENSVIMLLNKSKLERYALVVKNVHYRYPSILEPSGFTNENILPQECTQRGCDYMMSAIVAIDVYKGSISEEDANDPKKWRANPMQNMSFYRRWNDIPFFNTPVMIGSKFCNTLRVRDPRLDLTNHMIGGNVGCFVVSGQVKHLVLPTKLRVNVPLTKIKVEDGYILKVEMEYRSDHEMKLRTTSTTKVTVNGIKNRFHPTIEVLVQFIETLLDLRSIFILLDCKSIQEIINYLKPFGEYEHILYHQLIDEIFMNKEEKMIEKSELLCKIAEPEKHKSIISMMSKEFLPHVGQNLTTKAVHFGHIMHSTFMVYLGLAPEENKDSLINTRRTTPKIAIGEFFKSCYNKQFRPKLEKKLQKQLEKKGFNVLDTLPNHIPMNNNLLTSKNRNAINMGRFTVSVHDDAISKTNLTQQAILLNPTSRGHLAKHFMPVNKKGKDSRKRQTGGDAIHNEDLTDNVEGQLCGLINPRCNMSRLVPVYKSETIIHLTEMFVEKFKVDDRHPEFAKSTHVFVNGILIWRTLSPGEFCDAFREARRKLLIPWGVSIAFVGVTKNFPFGEVRITCDYGETVSPFFVASKINQLKKEIPRILEQIDDYSLWNYLIGEGYIEYIGGEELICDVRTLTAESARKNIPNGKFTWAEIEPSVGIMGASSLFTPGADKNQGPRNSYHCLDSNSFVLLADGTHAKITDVVPGDYVMSQDPVTIELVESKVLYCESKTTENDLFLITLEDSTQLQLTGDHKIRTPSGWVETKDLNMNDLVWAAENRENHKIVNVDLKKIIEISMLHDAGRRELDFVNGTFVEKRKHFVTDITIQGTNCFFAGKRQGKTIAVHNCNMVKQAHGAVTPATRERIDTIHYSMDYVQVTFNTFVTRFELWSTCTCTLLSGSIFP